MPERTVPVPEPEPVREPERTVPVPEPEPVREPERTVPVPESEPVRDARANVVQAIHFWQSPFSHNTIH